MAKKKPEIYEVEVKNWDKWNPDEKTVGWFKLSTNFFDDYAVHSLNANEKLLYLWLLCRCAQIKGSSVKFTRSSLAVHMQFRGSSMVDGLCKLAELGLIILQKERKKERKRVREIDNSKKTNVIETPFLERLEKIYEIYPKKEGKKLGLKTLSKNITSESEYTDLCKAVENYRSICKSEKKESKYIKQFSTFANNWTDYVELPESENFSQKSEGQQIPGGYGVARIKNWENE